MHYYSRETKFSISGRKMSHSFAHHSASCYVLPKKSSLKAEFAFCYLINIIPLNHILYEINGQNSIVVIVQIPEFQSQLCHQQTAQTITSILNNLHPVRYIQYNFFLTSASIFIPHWLVRLLLRTLGFLGFYVTWTFSFLSLRLIFLLQSLVQSTLNVSSDLLSK